mmetsp:Transcript_27145/g.64105  ORF Transcript_27145/g.64105 Transcript_27145/m.64105 type:complete len:86 (-) Transcript_27145:8-265(-)
MVISSLARCEPVPGEARGRRITVSCEDCLLRGKTPGTGEEGSEEERELDRSTTESMSTVIVGGVGIQLRIFDVLTKDIIVEGVLN